VQQIYAEELAREEQLHLLALVATGLGAEGLEDYETPSVRTAEWLAPPPAPEDRRDRVAEIAAVTGGEVDVL
jgi:hypothetical protein